MRTVLIADSDAFQRQLIDMLLAVDNHRVLGFETGRSVLEYLQSHVPDLVILDYSLPDINGADLCSKMKKVKRLAHVPVILVTAAHKLELVRGIATAVRADSVLAKPLGDKHLREHVLDLLKRDAQPRPEPVSAEPKTTEPKTTATAITIDPVLEQALANLNEPWQTTTPPSFRLKNPGDLSSSGNHVTPVPIDRDDEPMPYALELPAKLEAPKTSHTSEGLLPLFYEATSFHVTPNPEPLHEVRSETFQQDANAALESLLGQGVGETKDTSSGVFEFFDDDQSDSNTTDSNTLSDNNAYTPYHDGISEQELLDSLQTPLHTHALLNAPTLGQPVLNPPPFSHEAEEKRVETPILEPQPYTLGGGTTPVSTPSEVPSLAKSFEETVSDLEDELTSYRAQIQQLASENERLRETLLELETGSPLVTSKSYLDMVEELEMLRRLTDIQVKQMDNLQRQNRQLMEDAQQAQERRRGLFGFLQNKHQS
jgi:DNA-binding response OmpR family regulator